MSLMRLLQRKPDGEIVFREPTSGEVPAYAIFSHTWGEEEVSFQDIVACTGISKAGWEKIRFCASQAAADGLEYFWIDTCCIDKRNTVELSAAINSMFRWFQQATRCYVYLSDVSIQGEEQSNPIWKAAFRRSRWFTRGWTLQELIAPASVEFFSNNGERLGNKRSLEKLIHEITGIPLQALRGKPLSNFSVEERFSWVEKRQTTIEEDTPYCLLGIFGVYLPLIYGEGKAHAFRRLREEVEKAENRQFHKSLLSNRWKDEAVSTSENIASGSDWHYHANLDDVDRESIASTDTWSSDVTLDPAINRTLIEEFSAMVLEDRILKSAISMGSSNGGATSNRLERNLTRFLNGFAIGLQREAVSTEHIAVARFVGTRARLISKAISSRTLEKSSKPTANIHERVMLEQYLQSLPVFASNEINSTLDTDKNEDDDGEEDRDEGEESDHEQHLGSYDELSELSRVRKFVMTSTAWRRFQSGLLDWVCPPWSARVDRKISFWVEKNHDPHQLQQVLMVADDLANMDPRTLIVEGNKEKSYMNSFKGLVEKLSCQQWDWWPLGPYIRPSGENESRLAWRCPCGEQRFAILPRDLSTDIQRIAKWFLMAELEAYEEGIDLNIIPWDAGADSQPDLSGSQSSLPETRGSVSPSTHPSTHTAPLHSSTNTSPSSQTSIGRSGTRTTAAATATIEMEHCPDLHLFFVVDCGRNPKLEQKPTAATTPTSTTHRLSNDESLYRWIRQMYIRHRGWFHFYFGIRQFIGCDFYQFNHYAPKRLSPHSEIARGFPKDIARDYVFRAVKQFPPIGRHEFKQQVCSVGRPEHFSSHFRGYSILKAIGEGAWSLTISPKGFEFRLIPQNLPTSRLNFGGACRANAKSALERLPKRKFKVDENDDELDIFIGIYSREKISARHFIGWFLFFCSPTVLFALIYLFSLGHYGDLQNAFVLMGVTIPLLTILFSPFLIPQED